MGNWRTVNIDGVITNQAEVDAIRKALTDNDCFSWESASGMFYLQFSDGLAALGDWVPKIAGTKIHISGNLYERDCELDELERELNVFAAKCPSADIVVNAGGEYESLACVATFHVGNGECRRLEPEVPTIREISETMMFQRLMKAIGTP